MSYRPNVVSGDILPCCRRLWVAVGSIARLERDKLRLLAQRATSIRAKALSRNDN